MSLHLTPSDLCALWTDQVCSGFCQSYGCFIVPSVQMTCGQMMWDEMCDMNSPLYVGLCIYLPCDFITCSISDPMVGNEERHLACKDWLLRCWCLIDWLIYWLEDTGVDLEVLNTCIRSYLLRWVGYLFRWVELSDWHMVQTASLASFKTTMVQATTRKLSSIEDRGPSNHVLNWAPISNIDFWPWPSVLAELSSSQTLNILSRLLTSN